MFATQSFFLHCKLLPLYLILSVLPSRDIICYFLSLLLTSLKCIFLQAHPCWDCWPNFIISEVEFQVWVVAHCTYVPHDFKIHLSADLFLGLCLGNWRNHCSEHWVRVSFSMAVFHNTGWGVGTRILGLALLKFFALACGCPWSCPFKGLLPMCIHREHEGSVPSSPSSLLHALFAHS